MQILHFSDRELSTLAGWKTWKAGVALDLLFHNLKIQESLVSGVLKEGRKKTTTVVKVVDGEYVPSCMCSFYQQSHGFCPHAVALLIQAKESHQAALAQEASLNKLTAPSHEVKREQSDSWEVHGALVKSLEESLARSVVSLKISVRKGTGQGNALFPFLQPLGLPVREEQHLVQLDKSAFIELLRFQTRLSFLSYHDHALEGSEGSTRFPLRLVRREGETLHLELPVSTEWHYYPSAHLLVHTETAAYSLLPAAAFSLSPLLERLFSGESVPLLFSDFLAQESALDAVFHLEALHHEIQAHTEVLSPVFYLSLKGTVKALSGTLKVRYHEEELIPLSTESIAEENQLMGYDGKRDRFLSRDHLAEQKALRRLHDAGFTETQSRVVELRTESHFQEFLAYTLPQLEREKWEVELLGSARAFAQNMIRLALTLKVDPYEEKDEWVSFTYAFQTPKGQGMKAADAQRLIASGKQSFSLKTGKVALLSRKEYELISEAVLDSDVRESAGKFITSRRNLAYLQNLRIHGTSAQRVSPSTPSCPQAKPQVTFYNQLRDYQKEGLKWLISTLQRYHAALLADDMGLGKTVQSLALVEHLSQHQNGGHRERKKGNKNGAQDVKSSGKTLIVCPASLVTNWAEEAQKWLPHYEVYRNTICPNSEKEQVIELTSFQRYLGNAAAYQEEEYGLCIIDEASIIKNPAAKISQALSQQPATQKLALTGTPVENSAKDLWSIFQFLMPHYLGSLKHYTERFVTPLKQDGYTATLAGKRLKAKLDPVTLRRSKQAVLTELPPKTLRVEYCTPGPEQKKQFSRIKADYKKLKAENEGSSAIQVLTSILRLRQAANDLSLITKQTEPPSAKTQRLLQILSQTQPRGKKVLIFSQFAEMLECLKGQLTAAGHSCHILTGKTKNRDAEIQAFKSASGAQVFLISLKAGGYGLNLTEASTVIHYDPWWNPAVENQATDRAYRMGQSEPVSVIKLITADSIDERILKLQSQKQNLYNLTVDDEAPAFTGLSTEELQSLIA